MTRAKSVTVKKTGKVLTVKPMKGFGPKMSPFTVALSKKKNGKA